MNSCSLMLSTISSTFICCLYEDKRHERKPKHLNSPELAIAAMNLAPSEQDMEQIQNSMLRKDKLVFFYNRYFYVFFKIKNHKLKVLHFKWWFCLVIWCFKMLLQSWSAGFLQKQITFVQKKDMRTVSNAGVNSQLIRARERMHCCWKSVCSSFVFGTMLGSQTIANKFFLKMWCFLLLQLYPRRKYEQLCVCFNPTHRCESEDRSLKAPSGIRDMSLPWRDLRMWEEKSKIQKSQDCLSKVFQLHSMCACVGTDTYNKRRDLSPSNALTGMHRSRL